MKTLKLDYLQLPRDHRIVEILRSYGEQIASGSYNLLSYIVTDTRMEDQLESASFYLVVQELNKQHKLLSIDIEDAENISIKLWPLNSPKFEPYNAKLEEGKYDDFEDKIFEALDGAVAKQIFNFFVEQVKLKRDINKSWNM